MSSELLGCAGGGGGGGGGGGCGWREEGSIDGRTSGVDLGSAGSAHSVVPWA